MQGHHHTCIEHPCSSHTLREHERQQHSTRRPAFKFITVRMQVHVGHAQFICLAFSMQPIELAYMTKALSLKAAAVIIKRGDGNGTSAAEAVAVAFAPIKKLC